MTSCSPYKAIRLSFTEVPKFEGHGALTCHNTFELRIDSSLARMNTKSNDCSHRHGAFVAFFPEVRSEAAQKHETNAVTATPSMPYIYSESKLTSVPHGPCEGRQDPPCSVCAEHKYTIFLYTYSEHISILCGYSFMYE